MQHNSPTPGGPDISRRCTACGPGSAPSSIWTRCAGRTSMRCCATPGKDPAGFAPDVDALARSWRWLPPWPDRCRRDQRTGHRVHRRSAVQREHCAARRHGQVRGLPWMWCSARRRPQLQTRSGGVPHTRDIPGPGAGEIMLVAAQRRSGGGPVGRPGDRLRGPGPRTRAGTAQRPWSPRRTGMWSPGQ